ncbi:NorM family multidrug efflux MATE transporter [Pseudomonas sp. MAFF 311095]|uniref:Multidrug-efflux transporter n=1 Tax=Pseudomonas petroselini TaxID=2899822 RepID=A0ABS8QT60_9PSED|nr:NorM family multidrug efflux MATE transporter [Pseudomonas petroselini]MCD7038889.1 NorM family multidrug efflux MATE transporter [Pseudomonas petroselini]MCD7045731.1 NorM family multidrug efflux MATE transporter [Pseudomonas petroselini]MCD7068426.1 NorM family multidrug efflux MATE transporter [Pseudomonas petroselini]MCD7079091.1 NorM family multidrug efflux MATE transporter [Pseudomonas petroselini]
MIMQHPARTELWAILRLSGPLIASQLAHMLMVLTDTLMMARLSPEALAGGGLGAASYSFVSIFCIGVIAAVGTLVAIRQGAGDIEGATRLTQAGLWLAWLMALAAGLLLWNLKPLLLMFGQTETNVHSAGQFLTILPFALPGFLSFMALRGFTSAIGKAKPVMVISLGGAVANYLLNHALIEGMFGLPKLGLMGIGLVTAVVANGMALALMGYIHRNRAYEAYPLSTGLLRLNTQYLRELWRLGLPIGGTYAVEVGLFAFAALCMGTMGSTQLAAHQVALQIVSVAFMVPAGMSYAVTMRIGQHYGAGQLLQARLAGRVGIGFGAAVMLGFAVVLWLFSDPLIGLLIDHHDPAFHDVIVLAVSLLAVAAWFELFDGVQTIAMGCIRGLKDAKTTFLIGAGCYWLIGAPSAWLMAFTLGWGPTGVWWGLALGLACAAVSLTWAFEAKMKRMIRQEPDPLGSFQAAQAD